jgi:hypothetical protein
MPANPFSFSLTPAEEAVIYRFLVVSPRQFPRWKRVARGQFSYRIAPRCGVLLVTATPLPGSG